MEHGGPEEGVEVLDVLADEVEDFELWVVPVILRVPAASDSPSAVPEAGEIADGGVEPVVEIFAVFAGDGEAEEGRVAGDVPIAERFLEPVLELVFDGSSTKPSS